MPLKAGGELQIAPECDLHQAAITDAYTNGDHGVTQHRFPARVLQTQHVHQNAQHCHRHASGQHRQQGRQTGNGNQAGGDQPAHHDKFAIGEIRHLGGVVHD